MRTRSLAGTPALTMAVIATLLSGGAAATAQAQRGASDTAGFVIRDPTILRRCSGCHKADSSGHLGRLSYLRKTPEGWEASVRRMATLVSVKLEAAEARAVVKYLANMQGLAPEETRPGRFEKIGRASCRERV